MANIFELFSKIESGRKSIAPISHIIAGLGNFGSEYDKTRHNAGFEAVDCIAERHSVNINKAKFDALTSEIVVGEKRVLLMKPQLYMNCSGFSLKKAADFYKIPSVNIIVICDDINLDVGQIRIRRKGSDGGQKGVRNIIECLGTNEFPRIKIGVGKVTNGKDVVSWVLGRIPSEQKKLFEDSANKAAMAAELIVGDEIEKAMCEYN